MSLPAALTPAAADEFEAAAAWYENEQAGLGGRFTKAVLATIEAVRRNPRAYPRIHRQLRRAIVRRFPYCVIYSVELTFIRVIAVYHMHRNPSEWKTRR